MNRSYVSVHIQVIIAVLEKIKPNYIKPEIMSRKTKNDNLRQYRLNRHSLNIIRGGTEKTTKNDSKNKTTVRTCVCGVCIICDDILIPD